MCKGDFVAFRARHGFSRKVVILCRAANMAEAMAVCDEEIDRFYPPEKREDGSLWVKGWAQRGDFIATRKILQFNGKWRNYREYTIYGEPPCPEPPPREYDYW